MHATWSRIGHAPEVLVTGQRKSVKILGAIELQRARFHYRRDCVFNAETYLGFLARLSGFAGCEGIKWLIQREVTPKGLHYTSVAAAA